MKVQCNVSLNLVRCEKQFTLEIDDEEFDGMSDWDKENHIFVSVRDAAIEMGHLDINWEVTE